MKEYLLKMDVKSLDEFHKANRETIIDLLEEKGEFSVETNGNNRELFSRYTDLFFHDIKDKSTGLFDDLVIRYCKEEYGKIDEEAIEDAILYILDWLVALPLNDIVENGKAFDIFDINNRGMYFRAYLDLDVVKRLYPKDLYEGTSYGYFEPYRVSLLPSKEMIKYLIRWYYKAKVYYNDEELPQLTKLYIGMA